MPKLNDTQSVLLATAAQRDGGSIFPLPDSVSPGARVANAVIKLTGATLVEERHTNDPDVVHRTDGDLRYGLFVTPAGLQAIGIEPGDDQQASSAENTSSPAPLADPAPRATKASQVLALLSRPDGATLLELIEATGWLPHTTRAALTGLRKKGHSIERGKRGEVTCYTVLASEPA